MTSLESGKRMRYSHKYIMRVLRRYLRLGHVPACTLYHVSRYVYEIVSRIRMQISS